MKKNASKLKILLALLFISFFSINNNSIILNSTLLNDEKTNLDEIDQIIEKDPQTQASGDQTDPLERFGYSVNNTGTFDVIENASSIITERDFRATPGEDFNISTPEEWDVISMNYNNIESYHKNQTIRDSDFSQGPLASPWDGNEIVMDGDGLITQGWLLNPTPSSVYTNLEYDSSWGGDGFQKDDYGIWKQSLLNVNPEGLDIQRGELFQPNDETIEKFENFDENLPDFSFYEDLNTPFGGDYIDDGPNADDVDLYTEDGSLVVNIMPFPFITDTNPSAAWYSNFTLPYEADYAQITIGWAVDPASSFEANDDYRICARINNEFINGERKSQGGDLIAWSDFLPMYGNSESLILYNLAPHLDHDYIYRTYDISQYVSGLFGPIKFDFGAYAKEPSKSGDEDRIIAMFDFIEILYNTSNKYEVAKLEFDYLAMTDLTDIGGTSNADNPDALVNKISVEIRLDDGASTQWIKVLPFTQMTLFLATAINPTSNHVSFSIPHKYETILNNLNEFAIGIYINDDSEDRIDTTVFFDNLTFNINLKHPAPKYSGLQYRINSSSWNNILTDELTLDTSGWSGGQDRTFEFRPNPINISFTNKLYLNFKSELKVTDIDLGINGSHVSYEIDSANSGYGIWNITYNNTGSFTKLLIANQSNSFNLSLYNLYFLNLPALDSKGDKSSNWDVFKVVPPTISGRTYSYSKFNYTSDPTNQSARIRDAYKTGNWTLQARQLNYIKNCTFNNSDFLVVPIFYRNEIMQFNISLADDFDNDIDGNLSVSLLDENGTIVGGFPQYYTSKGKDIIGTINLSAQLYEPGDYYILAKWNDTGNAIGKTLRFGSIIKIFKIVNYTTADIITNPSPVILGDVANFTLYYRVLYDDWGIKNATIWVFENSTGTFKFWGTQWGDLTYKVGKVQHLGDGNYSVPLSTIGAPNGTYTIQFLIMKAFNQFQILYAELNITTANRLNVTITYGAFLNAQSEWVLNADNIPYVNDSLNSVLQFNLTNKGTKLPVLGGSIIGRIGKLEYTFASNEIGSGLYSLTLDTTYTNATLPGENQTLYITCSASNFSPIKVYVNITIDKIPSEIILEPVDPVYAEGEITITSTLLKIVDPENPKPNNYGNLNYYIYNQSTYYKNGLLNLITNGVYTKQVSLSGLTAGQYKIFVNGTANNCENDTSNEISLTILSQDPTNMTIFLPDPIRISRDIEIKTVLSYQNTTKLAYQQINMDITLLEQDPLNNESFSVSVFTEIDGEAIYTYIISQDYVNGTIIINTTYDGQEKVKACVAGIQTIIKGKIPINLTIIDHPNNSARVGYSATYQLRMNILDSEENKSLNNRVILFNAYYENDVNNPFVSMQLYTDSNGLCEYTISEIANGYENLTAVFIYLGNSKVKSGIVFRADNISAKWGSTFTYTPLPEIIRHGQEITFNMTIWSPENISLSFDGLAVEFRLNYGLKQESYTEYIVGNSLFFAFRVADVFDGDINITIEFKGSNKIASYTELLIIDVKDKIKVKIQFVEEPDTQYMTGVHYISVKVTDNDGNPLEDLEIIFELLDSRGNILDSATATSDEDGIASASLDFSEVGEKYTIKVYFEEEGYYAASELISEDIRIVDEFMVFLDMLPYILMAIGIIVAIWAGVHYGYSVPKRNKERKMLKEMYQKLSDVENLQYILIITKDAGVPCFSKSLAEVPIDESLVSGFLSAISSFGAEIGAKMKDGGEIGGLEELSYRQFKIILNEGKQVRVALLLLRRPSVSLKEKLKKFNNAFEEVFKDYLLTYTGKVLEDMEVTPLIEDIFEADLLYPHHLIDSKVSDYIKSLSKKDLAKQIVIIAKGEEFEGNFYLRDMINHLKTKGIEEIKSFDKLETLKSDKIVFAINPRTNYLIAQLQPYIRFLTKDDRNVLFALFDGNIDEISINKYLKKQNIKLSPDAKLEIILGKLKKMELIEGDNIINETGSAIATLLKLIPEL